jgi:hypothetical protein
MPETETPRISQTVRIPHNAPISDDELRTMAQEDPPKTASGRTRKTAPPVEPTVKGKRTPTDRKLALQIEGAYTALGMGVTTIGMQRGDERVMMSGQSFMEKADDIAEQWMVLADANPKIKAALKKFTETSAMAGLVGVHVACLMPIIVSYLPAPLAGAFASAAMQDDPSQNGNGYNA